MELGLVINNGWKTGDFHFIFLDIFNEQPPDHTYGYCGVTVGLLGICIGLGIKYVKN